MYYELLEIKQKDHPASNTAPFWVLQPIEDQTERGAKPLHWDLTETISDNQTRDDQLKIPFWENKTAKQNNFYWSSDNSQQVELREYRSNVWLGGKRNVQAQFADNWKTRKTIRWCNDSTNLLKVSKEVWSKGSRPKFKLGVLRWFFIKVQKQQYREACLRWDSFFDSQERSVSG